MLIDFHTHIFPDIIAKRTVEALKKQSTDNGYPIENHSPATLSGILGSMQEKSIDISVVLPIATKPSHFESMNRFASEVNKQQNVISFGAIHPQDDDLKARMKQIKDMGFKGITLHPYFQNVKIDDIKFIKTVEEAVKNDLIVAIHSGLDSGFKTDMANPKDTLKLVKNIDCSKVVLAHMGGCMQWDLVEEYLVGENVLFDTSYCLDIIKDQDQFFRIVKNHGADKILFGSDFPWTDGRQNAHKINQMPFSQEEKDAIFAGNAKRILGL